MTITSNKWPPHHLENSVAAISGIATGGGAAADMTITAGCRGITSIAYNAATGAYLITFAEVGANFLGAWFSVLSATGTTTAYVAHPVVYSAANKTLSIYVSDIATPTAHDLSTSEQLMIRVEWADSSAP